MTESLVEDRQQRILQMLIASFKLSIALAAGPPHTLKDLKLMPIQDVKTEWNSRFSMLRRAKQLRAILTLFYVKNLLPCNE
jgi:hypothetical protein